MKILIQPETEQDLLIIPDGTEIQFYDGIVGTWDVYEKCGTKLINVYHEETRNIDEIDFEDNGDGSFWLYEYKSPNKN